MGIDHRRPDIGVAEQLLDPALVENGFISCGNVIGDREHAVLSGNCSICKIECTPTAQVYDEYNFIVKMFFKIIDPTKKS